MCHTTHFGFSLQSDGGQVHSLTLRLLDWPRVVRATRVTLVAYNVERDLAGRPAVITQNPNLE